MHTEEDARTCTATLAWPDACHVKPWWHHISKFKTPFSHHFRNLAATWTPQRFIQLCLLVTHDNRKKRLSVPKLQRYLELNMSCWQISTHPFLYLLYPHMCWQIYNIIHIKSNNRIKPALLLTLDIKEPPLSSPRQRHRDKRKSRISFKDSTSETSYLLSWPDCNPQESSTTHEREEY